MKIHEIFEVRSHPELNVKVNSFEEIKNYIEQHPSSRLYLHFNTIEKVGIHLQSKNTYGPFGIYAMPMYYVIDNGESRFNRIVNINKPIYVNILQENPGIKILNLNIIDNNFIQLFFNKINSLSKKKSRVDPSELTGEVSKDWRLIQSIIGRKASRSGTSSQALWNIILRSMGYDALYDSSSLLNDNPNQIVFLHSKAFTLVKTIPIRLNKSIK